MKDKPKRGIKKMFSKITKGVIAVCSSAFAGGGIVSLLINNNIIDKQSVKSLFGFVVKGISIALDFLPDNGIWMIVFLVGGALIGYWIKRSYEYKSNKTFLRMVENLNQDNEGDAEYTFFDKDGVKKVNIKKQKVSGNMEEKRVSNIIQFPRKNDLEVK